MEESLSITVTPKLRGTRLDVLVKNRLSWLTNTQLERLIKEEKILVNGEKTKKGKRLKSADTILIFFNDNYDLSVVHDLTLEVLYEDDYLIAIDKPAGIACHPTKKHLNYNIINYFRQNENDAGEIRLLHRLDYETSGVLLLSKSKEAHQILQEDFEDRKIEKMYRAIVHGHPQNHVGNIIGDIIDAPSRIELKKGVDPGNEQACTDYEVEQEFSSYSLVRIFPRTGKQHQIRVHFSYLGHPIVGDKLYGKNENYFLDFLEGVFGNDYFERELGLARHALHACELSFAHPIFKKKVTIVSPLPEDMLRFITKNS